MCFARAQAENRVFRFRRSYFPAEPLLQFFFPFPELTQLAPIVPGDVLMRCVTVPYVLDRAFNSLKFFLGRYSFSSRKRRSGGAFPFFLIFKRFFIRFFYYCANLPFFIFAQPCADGA